MTFCNNSHYLTYAFLFKRLGERTFWAWERKGIEEMRSGFLLAEMSSRRIDVFMAVLFSIVAAMLLCGDATAFVNNHQTKTLEDIEGLTRGLVSEALLSAKEDVVREDRGTPRKRRGSSRSQTYQGAHYRTRYDPALEPARKRALILERAAGKLADALGWVDSLRRASHCTLMSSAQIRFQYCAISTQ